MRLIACAWAQLGVLCEQPYVDVLVELTNIEIRSGRSSIIAIDQQGLLSQSAGRGVVAANPLSCMHWSRRFEYPWALDALRIKTTDRVLEVGPGTSPFKWLLARASEHVATIDTEHCDERQDMLRLGLFVDAWVGDARRLPYADESFDKIVSISVIEHTDARLCLKEMARALRPGGRLVVTVDIASDPTEDFPLGLEDAAAILSEYGTALPSFPSDVLTASAGKTDLRVLCFAVEKQK